MRYTLTMRTEDLEEARRLTFSVPGVEGACFLLCGESRTADEARLLCRHVLPVDDESYLERRPDFLSLDSPCYVAAAKRARDEDMSIIFVHSHPGGLLEFSEQDDREEPKLQEFLAARVPERLHGALVLTDTGIVGRVWDSGFAPMELVRVIGERYTFHHRDVKDNLFPEYFDRQVLAFGPDVQVVLSHLHIGVVGAGGTGSATFEQLVRLGAGKISVFDKDTFESSNVNRVYGSGSLDSGQFKVELARRNAERIGVGTEVIVYPEHITDEETARALRECDIIFGCTDKEAPRGILTQLALRYIIPVFDTGVLIDSVEGHIRDVIGRVTTLQPGEACLFCRNRISPNGIAFETFPSERQERLIAEGYAPELVTRSPAVVPFTTAVAATAVAELLHRLTGFMGSGRESTEVIQRFDKNRINTNRQECKPSCICSDRTLWGSGDAERYLGMWG